jgi:hypothetical protein
MNRYLTAELITVGYYGDGSTNKKRRNVRASPLFLLASDGFPATCNTAGLSSGIYVIRNP